MVTIVIKRPEDHEMCPVGYHVVRGHERRCSSGTKTWVDAHNAKSPARNKTVLFKENIHYVYWNANLEAYGSLKGIRSFAEHHKIDAAILFWLAYWQEQGLKFPADFDPLIVKVLIAAESSFDPEVGSRISSATGLMQILKSLQVQDG